MSLYSIVRYIMLFIMGIVLTVFSLLGMRGVKKDGIRKEKFKQYKRTLIIGIALTLLSLLSLFLDKYLV